ncbi:MAG: glycosyltransferase family 9 protein, partial [bacterium]|nr:glycosyltransferase family 9 protein [Candidatus Colisoma equi]
MAHEKILIIKLGALGDVMMNTGLIRAVIGRHPGADFTLMTHASIVPLMKQSGWFADFIVDNRRGYGFSELKRICWTELARRKWDVIYDLQSSHRTLKVYYPLVRLLTRHPLTWGVTTPEYPLPHGIVLRRTSAKRSFTWGRETDERFDVNPPPPDISFCHGEHRNFALLPERYVLIIPGCSPTNPEKRWPAERYRAVSEHFGAKGLKSVVLGTSAEAAEIQAVVKGNPHAVDFMNKASLIDIPDLARGAAIFIGNDTGPSHMARLAGAKGLKSVVLGTSAEAAEIQAV